MNHIRIILLSVFSLATGVQAQNGDVRMLTLEEALHIANTHAYQVLMAEGELQKARGQNLESWSGFLPQLSVSENYIKSTDPVTAFSIKLKQGIFTQQDFSLSALNNPDAIDNFTTAFQIRQPILNLDAIYGKSAARMGVKARKAGLARTREAIALEVKKAYFGLILARENLRAIEEAVQSAQSHRDDAKVALEQGLINEADYLAAEVRLGELKEQRITAEHQVANASDGLKFVMGIRDAALIVPTDSLAAPKEMLDTEKQNIAARSDLQALQFKSTAARRNIWMKRSNWVPRLNGFGGVEWNAGEAFQDDASSWAFGVQLEWKFFNGLANFGKSKQASAEAEVAAVEYRQAEEQAKLEVRQARRALKAAEQRIAVAQTAVTQARESHRITAERFKEGMVTTSDLLDKEVALTNAKLRYLKAKHDHAIAVSELQFALGQ